MATAAAPAASRWARLRAWVRRVVRPSALVGHDAPPPSPAPAGVPAPASTDSAGQVLATVVAACEAQRRLQFDFRGTDGAESLRDVEPHRLVQSGSRWYVVAYDVGRGDWRTFRLDRMRPRPSTGPSFTPRALPTGADAPYLSDIATSTGGVPAAVDLSVQLPTRSAIESVAAWASGMLRPGAAVIVDTETTDLPGAICEIAVVDATTGEVLLDTLVDPRVDMSTRAQAIHGIDPADLVGAPTWAEVLPRFLAVVDDRTVLAYNVEFDEAVIRADTARYGLGLGPLDAADRWGCVMRQRAQTIPGGSPLALGAGHRAAGDALAALQVLREMATLRPVPC